MAASWLTRVCFIIITAHRYLLPLISEPSSFEIFCFGGMPSWLISSRSPLTTFGAHYILWYELRPSPLRLTESLAALCACSGFPWTLVQPFKSTSISSSIWYLGLRSTKKKTSVITRIALLQILKIKKSKGQSTNTCFSYGPLDDRLTRTPTIPAQWPWPFSKIFPLATADTWLLKSVSAWNKLTWTCLLPTNWGEWSIWDFFGTVQRKSIYMTLWLVF